MLLKDDSPPPCLNCEFLSVPWLTYLPAPPNLLPLPQLTCFRSLTTPNVWHWPFSLFSLSVYSATVVLFNELFTAGMWINILRSKSLLFWCLHRRGRRRTSWQPRAAVGWKLGLWAILRNIIKHFHKEVVFGHNMGCSSDTSVKISNSLFSFSSHVYSPEFPSLLFVLFLPPAVFCLLHWLTLFICLHLFYACFFPNVSLLSNIQHLPALPPCGVKKVPPITTRSIITIIAIPPPFPLYCENEAQDTTGTTKGLFMQPQLSQDI